MFCAVLLAFNAGAATPPLITLQPVSQIVTSGSNATFTVVASTGTSLSYQWCLNGVSIKGATNSVYTVVKVQITNAGPYYVNVINAGGTMKSAIATLNVNAPPGSTLATPWVTADIGSVGLTGSAYNVSTVYTVNGAGANAAGATSDNFRYVYQAMPGNGSLVARVTGLSDTNVNANAGIMIRETTATGSRYLAAFRQGNGAMISRSRVATSGATTSVTGATLALPNCWVKLVRTGNNIVSSTSTNGTAWMALQTNSLTMATNVVFGLIATSGNTNVLDSDTFDNITVVP